MKSVFDKKVLVAALIVFSVIAIVLGFLIREKQKLEKAAKAQIITDGLTYDNGGVLKVKIENLSLKNMCFSSCYPYLLERKDWIWKYYSYQDCVDSNLAKDCVEPGETKAFEAVLPRVKDGTHRFAIPVCEGCKTGEDFRETERFYSNEFEIK